MHQKLYKWWNWLKAIFLSPKIEEPPPPPSAEEKADQLFRDLKRHVTRQENMADAWQSLANRNLPRPHRIVFASIEHIPEMQELYVETIHAVNSQDYSPEQIRVWALGVKDIQRWKYMLTQQYVVVAQCYKTLLGFASLDKGTYIDFLYVHSDYQRLGIASALYEALEKEALSAGAKVLTSDVSKTARAFFESKGFRVVAEQRFEKQGVEMSNFKMEKTL